MTRKNLPAQWGRNNRERTTKMAVNYGYERLLPVPNGRTKYVSGIATLSGARRAIAQAIVDNRYATKTEAFALVRSLEPDQSFVVAGVAYTLRKYRHHAATTVEVRGK